MFPFHTSWSMHIHKVYGPMKGPKIVSKCQNPYLFDLHLQGNRAPYMLPFHTNWFTHAHQVEGLMKFVRWSLQVPFIYYAITCKVHSFLEHSCVILSSFKIVIIINNILAEIKTKSGSCNCVLKMNGLQLRNFKLSLLQTVTGIFLHTYPRFTQSYTFN